MARKRPLPESSQEYESEDEGSEYDEPISTSKRSTAKKKDKKKENKHGEVARRMAAAGIGPRSVAFGGTEGLSAKAVERYQGGREKLDLRKREGETETKKRPPRKVETKALGNTLLCFQPLKPRAPQILQYPEAQALLTTMKQTKKNKKKKKKDDEDSSSEDSDSEDDDGDENAVNFGKIVEKPDRVQTVIIAGPAPQVPWTLNAFGRFPDPKKSRPSRKKKKVEEEEEEDEDEVESKKKKKTEDKPKKPTRTFKDDKAIFILHDTPFKQDSKVHAFKKVITHRPDANKTMNARFLCMMYTDKGTQRLSLRIAITNALPNPENYAKTENMIWVQDFPERDKATTTIQRGSELSNGTHTTFSAAFFSFVAGGNDLPEHAEHKSFIDIENHFDFSKSANVQPVLSIAGSLKNQHEVDQAGGFNSLAKAIKNFGVELGGIWTIEYITPLSLPIDDQFLKYLYAAVQGVNPFELVKQETAAAKQAKESYRRKRIKIGYPTVETVESSHGYEVGKYALRFDTRNDLDFDRLSSTDARRIFGPSDYSIMHDFTLKSERINHSNILLIYHTDIDQGPDLLRKCEGFVYIGSHSPTTQSWGKYKMKGSSMTSKLANSEFGVLMRFKSEDWSSLVEEINDFVPYKRGKKVFKPYEEGDIPFTPGERVVQSKKKKKDD